MRKLRIWYGYRHNDFSMHELEFESEAKLINFVSFIPGNGGLWIENKFIPYHRINGIENAGEQND